MIGVAGSLQGARYLSTTAQPNKPFDPMRRSVRFSVENARLDASIHFYSTSRPRLVFYVITPYITERCMAREWHDTGTPTAAVVLRHPDKRLWSTELSAPVTTVSLCSAPLSAIAPASFVSRLFARA